MESIRRNVVTVIVAMVIIPGLLVYKLRNDSDNVISNKFNYDYLSTIAIKSMLYYINKRNSVMDLNDIILYSLCNDVISGYDFIYKSNDVMHNYNYDTI